MNRRSKARPGPPVIINDRGVFSIMLLATDSRKVYVSKFIENEIAIIPFPVSIHVPVKNQCNCSNLKIIGVSATHQIPLCNRSLSNVNHL